MSSRKLTKEEKAQLKAAEALAFKAASEKGTRLMSIAEKISNARRSITAKFMEIAELLDSSRKDLLVLKNDGAVDEKKSAAAVRAFAHTDGHIPRDEIRTFERLAALGGYDREILTAQGSGFAVLKAIVDDNGLRDDVVTRMRANIVMDTAAVRRVRLQRKLAAETPLQTFLRLNPHNTRLESRKETRAAIKSFEKDAASLVVALGDLARAGDLSEEEHKKLFDPVSAIAQDLVSRFHGFFETQGMPSEWAELYSTYSLSDDYGDITAMLLALETLASGDFYIPDEEHGGYRDTADLNIDHSLIEAVGRMVGISVDQLLKSPKRGRARRVPPAVAKANTPKLVEPSQFLTSVEICAGAGGQALGLHAAGFRAHAIFEWEKDAAATLKQHFHGEKNRVFAEDIRRVDFSHYRGRVDLLAGGVPCQSFSTAGLQKGEKDDRDLFRRAVEIVDEIQPRAFFFENVRGFSHAPHLSYRTELSAAFAAIGYHCRILPIRGSDYGLAQGRPRVVFVGFRDHDAMTRFQLPPVFPQWRSSLAGAIGDLVSVNGWKGFEDWKKVADGACPTIIGGSRKSDKFSFSAGYRHKAWELLGIDSTVIGSEAPSAEHKGPFKLTLEMGARIQGFPDGWRFQCDKNKKKQIKSQIANAFPPIMAKAVGLAIHAALKDVEFDYEKALRIPFTTPAAPKPKEKITSGRLRLNLGNSAPGIESMFFDEIWHDENTGEELIIEPGDYRVREPTE